ncbi:hypothetical protein HNQ01_001110 [Leptothrix sp. C29]|uniref:Uncharacterized protein n=2 Tax=Sphaerotilus uruguayifluvii TaxID=2735897 RepID=A0ABX2G1W2_9BURK|nr:hypothetical protein [Leptothrix sp. C29]
MNGPARHDWREDLPAGFMARVVEPRRFVVHVDAQAHARKTVGLDADGRRCYVHHLHTEVDERFDIDEFPVEVPLRRERRVAWRLQGDDCWLLQVERLDRLESCRPQHERLAPVLLREAELGL